MSGDEPNLLSHSEDLSEREARLEKETLEHF